MTTIARGMVVQLISGGPQMSVVDVGDYEPIGPKDGAKCVWFDDKKKHCEEVFDVIVLKEYVRPAIAATIMRR
jgi:uncharacterized protein YodC (DUF2158 family)